MNKSVVPLIITLSIIFTIQVTAEDYNIQNSAKTYPLLLNRIQSARDIIHTDPVVAANILEECIDLSRSQNEDSLFYTARELYASSFVYRNILDSAIILYNELLIDIPKNKYLIVQAMLYNNIGTLYGRNQDYNTAIDYLSIADSLAGITKSEKHILSISNNIANIYFYNKDIESAIKYYKLALRSANLIGLDEAFLWRFKNNILSCFIESKNIDSARSYFYKLISLPSNSNIDKARSILNYSYLFSDSGHQDSAFYFINMAQDSIQNSDETTIVSINISRLRSLLKLKQDRAYVDSLLFQMKQFSVDEISTEALEIYQDIYNFFNTQKEYKEALSYHIKYVSVSDSLKAKSNSAKIEAVQLKLKYQKLQSRVNIQNQQIQQQNTKETLLYVIVGSLFIIISFTIYLGMYRKKIISILSKQKIEISKQNKLLEEKNNQLESQNIEIETMLKELTQSKEYLEKLNSQKDTFVSIFTHQLTNQVQAILMSAEAMYLGKQKTPEMIDKFSEILYNASNHLRNMLSNLMEWARTQTGNVQTNPVHFELQEIIDRNISSNKQIINKKNIDIIKVCKEQIVYADKAMIDTVFKNVISNAVKYSYEGGKIEFSCHIENNFIVSYIKDYGTGIKIDLLEKLFNIETRVATKGTNGEQGSGLGLSICKELLTLNSGKIEIQTNEGRGTLVKIYLPK